MQLPGVIVLIYAHPQDAPEHQRYAAWLRAPVATPEPFGGAGIILAAFFRIVTNPRIFRPAAFAPCALFAFFPTYSAPFTSLLAPRRHPRAFL